MSSIRPKRKTITPNKEINSPPSRKRRQLNNSKIAHSHCENNKQQEPLKEKISYIQKKCEFISVTIDKIEEMLKKNIHHLDTIEEHIENYELKNLFSDENSDNNSFYSSSPQTASNPTPTISENINLECDYFNLDKDISFSQVLIEENNHYLSALKLEQKNSLPKIKAQRTGLTSIRIIKG